MKIEHNLQTFVQNYFYQYLINQKECSQKTISSYRDTFKILFKFIQEYQGIKPHNLKLTDINKDIVLEFLDYLETKRKNSARTRNARLMSIRSFLQYVSLEEPSVISYIRPILAIPLKKFDRSMVDFLTREEIDAIINFPNNTWSGLRDRVLFATLYNTGARVSEIINVRICDIDINKTKSILLNGKGRKERVIPLWKSTLNLLNSWIKKNNMSSNDLLFLNRQGKNITRSGVEYRLKIAVANVLEKFPSLRKKKFLLTLFATQQHYTYYNQV
jgi:integrase/recombinase XerD